MSKSQSQSGVLQWENATSGAVAGFATVAAMHPLDVVRTRFQGFSIYLNENKRLDSVKSLRFCFQVFCKVDGIFAVNDGRVSTLPTYKNTVHAIFTIARLEGLRGLYAGFYPAVLGSSVSWGLYFLFYGRAKQRYSKNGEKNLSPALHLASAAEAGALVCLCTNPVWLVKTRLQLQNPLNQIQPYSGLYDAFRTIMREEGFSALYKGIIPGLFLVSHGAIQFTAYEELRKFIVDLKTKDNRDTNEGSGSLLNSVDYAFLGASSKIAAILMTYPFQVIRARLQQRPGNNGIPIYMDSFHVMKETVRFEGIRGFYKGITPNLLKNVPAASITFVVYENVLNLLKSARRKD